MFTTIVVGTDGSDSASLAVRAAADLARAGGATLRIIHAFQTERVVLGSVPNTIAHHASCSVLIVHTTG